MAKVCLCEVGPGDYIQFKFGGKQYKVLKAKRGYILVLDIRKIKKYRVLLDAANRYRYVQVLNY
jgi:hypothetical protein